MIGSYCSSKGNTTAKGTGLKKAAQDHNRALRRAAIEGGGGWLDRRELHGTTKALIGCGTFLPVIILEPTPLATHN